MLDWLSALLRKPLETGPTTFRQADKRLLLFKGSVTLKQQWFEGKTMLRPKRRGPAGLFQCAHYVKHFAFLHGCPQEQTLAKLGFPVSADAWGEWRQRVPREFIRLDKVFAEAGDVESKSSVNETLFETAKEAVQCNFPRTDDRVARVLSSVTHFTRTEMSVENASDILEVLTVEEKYHDLGQLMIQLSQVLEFLDAGTLVKFCDALELLATRRRVTEPRNSGQHKDSWDCDEGENAVGEEGRRWGQGPKGWTSAMDTLVDRVYSQQRLLKQHFDDKRFEEHTRMLRCIAQFFYVSSPLRFLDPLSLLCRTQLNGLFAHCFDPANITTSPAALNGVVTFAEACALRHTFLSPCDATSLTDGEEQKVCWAPEKVMHIDEHTERYRTFLKNENRAFARNVSGWFTGIKEACRGASFLPYTHISHLTAEQSIRLLRALQTLDGGEDSLVLHCCGQLIEHLKNNIALLQLKDAEEILLILMKFHGCAAGPLNVSELLKLAYGAGIPKQEKMTQRRSSMEAELDVYLFAKVFLDMMKLGVHQIAVSSCIKLLHFRSCYQDTQALELLAFRMAPAIFDCSPSDTLLALEGLAHASTSIRLTTPLRIVFDHCVTLLEQEKFTPDEVARFLSACAQVSLLRTSSTSLIRKYEGYLLRDTVQLHSSSIARIFWALDTAGIRPSSDLCMLLLRELHTAIENPKTVFTIADLCAIAVPLIEWNAVHSKTLQRPLWAALASRPHDLPSTAFYRLLKASLWSNTMSEVRPTCVRFLTLRAFELTTEQLMACLNCCAAYDGPGVSVAFPSLIKEATSRPPHLQLAITALRFVMSPAVLSSLSQNVVVKALTTLENQLVLLWPEKNPKGSFLASLIPVVLLAERYHEAANSAHTMASLTERIISAICSLMQNFPPAPRYGRKESRNQLQILLSCAVFLASRQDQNHAVLSTMATLLTARLSFADEKSLGKMIVAMAHWNINVPQSCCRALAFKANKLEHAGQLHFSLEIAEAALKMNLLKFFHPRLQHAVYSVLMLAYPETSYLTRKALRVPEQSDRMDQAIRNAVTYNRPKIPQRRRLTARAAYRAVLQQLDSTARKAGLAFVRRRQQRVLRCVRSNPSGHSMGQKVEAALLKEL